MREWVYSWASSDGLKHEGEITAPSKDEAYAELRKRGIHPIRVVERIQPIVRRGFRGLRKRDFWLLFGIVVVLVGVSCFLVLRAVSSLPIGQAGLSHQTATHFNSARPRHYVELPKGFQPEQIFTRPSERYLARFAMPGEYVRSTMDERVQRDFYDACDLPIVLAPEDSAETVELKRIVMGLKEEARKYLNMPEGLKKFAIFLEERQLMERDYRKRMEGQVKSGAITLAEANDLLRAMGLREISR